MNFTIETKLIAKGYALINLTILDRKGNWEALILENGERKIITGCN